MGSVKQAAAVGVRYRYCNRLMFARLPWESRSKTCDCPFRGQQPMCACVCPAQRPSMARLDAL